MPPKKRRSASNDMSTKLIDALPPPLKMRLNSPRLKDLTFRDISIVSKTFRAFQDDDSIAYGKKVPVCLPCGTWP